MMDGDAYDAADNSARSYAAAIDAIRMEGVKAGRFLPLADRPDEIKASPIVTDVRRIGDAILYCGDCTAIVPLLAGNRPWIDACVTDPPYELGIMGKGWDSSGVAVDWRTWGGVRIALKPGGHLCAFAGSRTYHRIAGAIDHAGFEVRDQVMWIYGSGFPKSMDVAKQVDKLDVVGPRRDRALRFTEWMRSTGITAKQINEITKSCMASHFLTDKQQPELATRAMFEVLRPHLPTVPEWVEDLIDSREVETENLKRRPVIGEHQSPAQASEWRASYQGGHVAPPGSVTAAFSPDAARWEGWGTALKPAHEPVCFARKPLAEQTVAANVLAWATGAINVDAGRVGERKRPKVTDAKHSGHAHSTYGAPSGGGNVFSDSRWPANVAHDGSLEVLEAFPPSARDAVRFFYSAKVGKEEREAGLDGADKKRGGMVSNTSGQHITRRDGGEPGPRANHHPTVKPVDLMRWLCRLVTAPGGTILDPFMGSGSTGVAAIKEGFRFVGVEQSPEYFEIACRRIAHAIDEQAAQADLVTEITKATSKLRRDRTGGGQGDMF